MEPLLVVHLNQYLPSSETIGAYFDCNLEKEIRWF